MNIQVTLKTVPDDATLALLQEILAGVRSLTREVRAESKNMSAELDKLQAAVEKNNTVDQSAITLLQGLSQQIKDLKNDPAALQALADSLDGQSQALADAVVANTPAA